MSRKIYVRAFMVLCLSLLTISICKVNAQPSTILAVDPQTSSVNVGDTFKVNVTITDVADLTGWQLFLYYQNTVLNCSNLAAGPFLQGAPLGTYQIFNINNTYSGAYGRISAAIAVEGQGWTANGSGVILTVTFKAVGGSSTDLILNGTKLADAEIPPQPIPHTDSSGIVNVAGANHDVAVTNVAPIKTVIGRNYAANFNVTVSNLGFFVETFNTTLYSNLTLLTGPFSTILPIGTSSNLTATWNTTGYAYGNYSVSAIAGPVSGDVNPANNNFTISQIAVTIPGDINGDFKVTLVDLVFLANAYGTTPASGGVPGAPHAWNPNADIDGNNIVGLTDLVILALHYGQHYP